MGVRHGIDKIIAWLKVLVRGDRKIYNTNERALMVAELRSISFVEILAALEEDGFDEAAAKIAVSKLVSALRRYAASRRRDLNTPWKTETFYGLGFQDLFRDTLIVRMSEDDLLSLDQAERALSIIENKIRDSCREIGGKVEVLGMGEFTLSENPQYELTPAEKDWIEKMEEEQEYNTYLDENDRRESKNLLDSVRTSLKKQPRRPAFEILFY